MAARPLIILGTPGGGWLPLAEGLLRLATEAPRWQDGALNDWPDSLLSEAPPDARFLIFVEGPAEALSACLSRPAACEPDAALHRWRDGARRLLHHVTRHPQRCLVVDAAEARRHPAALLAVCQQRLGMTFGDVPPSDFEEPDALLGALGTALAMTDMDAGRLFAQLQSSCVPLGAAPIQRWPALNPTAAMHAWNALGRERADLRARLATLLREVEADGRERSRLRTEHELAERAQQARAREVTLLRGQLVQVQHELRDQFLLLQETRRRAEPLSAARLLWGTVRETDPHRECSVTLQGVRFADRSLERLAVRLVEHHGRPGIALFAVDDAPTALSAWQPNGREDGSDFMLIVPSDAPARRLLLSLGDSDWRFLVALVDTLARPSEATSDGRARWASVAQRLRRQLADLPRRFRFDQVTIAQEDGGDAWRIAFASVGFGDRRCRQLVLRWRPGAGPNGRLELLGPTPADETPPWSGWPCDDGRCASAWPVPLADVPMSKRTWAWQQMGHDDRAMLLAVLDALPAAAQQADPAIRERLSAAAAWPLRVALRAVHGSRLRRVWRAVRGDVVVP